MPRAKLSRNNIDDRCLYDKQLSWAAKGLLMRLIKDEKFSGEITFDKDDWPQISPLLVEIERNGYICVSPNGNDDYDICIL